ncbi:DUF5668 domain-containing protein [Petrocella sp. FN5]|uniref:DUF5668 domain-containing protein n=1 Tax=Petrocella sp. FN5 TaxID=3032002 RepID=UPI0023D9AEE7|nr:DUF5668 domain-containing protein [Petrocella sp. FN5]MDF1617805.1 DUF5668 domain-containing protein [Petrocella sp. FN5]
MKKNKSAGILLILFGSLYLVLQILSQLNILVLNFWNLWPLTTIAIGIAFEAIYYGTKKYPGFLIPGGIFTTIGLLHLFEVITHWQFSVYTWPIYVLSISIGFFHYHMITQEQWSKVISIIFLTLFALNTFIVATILLDGLISFNFVFSTIIIIVGLLLIQRARPHK